MKDVICVMEGRARFEGPEYKTFRRIGGDTSGERDHGGSRPLEIHLHLGSPRWTLVHVTAEGWEEIPGEQCMFKTIRNRQMQELPLPEAGELLEDHLRTFINVESDRDYRLIVAWLVCAFREIGEYPILSITGEQGSSMSTLARLLRMLIDPNKSLTRSSPREERDLIVAAANSHVISLDNLSTLPFWLSDGLCRISAGGGFSARALHTNMEEVVVDH